MPKPISIQSTTPAPVCVQDPQWHLDALALGAPDVLRAHLQACDSFALVQAERRSHCYTTAVLGSLVSLNFVPELWRAGTYCLSTVSAENTAGCHANAAPALGALCGLAAAFCAGYALYSETNAVHEFAQRKDAELHAQHAKALPSELQEDADKCLLSRYSALPLSQRQRLQQAVDALS